MSKTFCSLSLVCVITGEFMRLCYPYKLRALFVPEPVVWFSSFKFFFVALIVTVFCDTQQGLHFIMSWLGIEDSWPSRYGSSPHCCCTQCQLPSLKPAAASLQLCSQQRGPHLLREP